MDMKAEGDIVRPLAPTDHLIDDRRARRNALVLGGANALYGGNISILFTLGSILGHSLADNKALATLPVSAIMVGTMLSTVPASMFMRRFDRRSGFTLGVGIGLVGVLIGLGAIYLQSFWLFCLAMLCSGTYQAFAQYYRFAAVDMASEAFKPRAIAWVLAGGIVAALMGPEILIWTREAVPGLPFAGTYFACFGLGLLALALLRLVDIPAYTAAQKADSGRPLGDIMRQPTFIVAVACAMVSYSIMTMLMTATPLAMVMNSFTVDDAAFIVQWHLLAMFAPSFFTGRLIVRFGVLRIIMTGLALLMACGAVALSGVDIEHFWLALVLLGFGWNFAFIGATDLLTDCYTTPERNKTQAVNDLLIFGTVAGASFAAGGLLQGSGWAAVNLALFPFVAAAAGLIVWLALYRRRVAIKPAPGR